MDNVIDMQDKRIEHAKLALDKQIADHLSVSPAEVRRLRHEGRLLAVLAERAEMDSRLNEGRY